LLRQRKVISLALARRVVKVFNNIATINDNNFVNKVYVRFASYVQERLENLVECFFAATDTVLDAMLEYIKTLEQRIETLENN